MQKSAKCTFMYGEMTEKATVAKLELAMENHSMEQFEILLYKKNRKSLKLSSSKKSSSKLWWWRRFHCYLVQQACYDSSMLLI